MFFYQYNNINQTTSLCTSQFRHSTEKKYGEAWIDSYMQTFDVVSCVGGGEWWYLFVYQWI